MFVCVFVFLWCWFCCEQVDEKWWKIISQSCTSLSCTFHLHFSWWWWNILEQLLWIWFFIFRFTSQEQQTNKTRNRFCQWIRTSFICPSIIHFVNLYWIDLFPWKCWYTLSLCFSLSIIIHIHISSFFPQVIVDIDMKTVSLNDLKNIQSHSRFVMKRRDYLRSFCCWFDVVFEGTSQNRTMNSILFSSLSLIFILFFWEEFLDFIIYLLLLDFSLSLTLFLFLSDFFGLGFENRKRLWYYQQHLDTTLIGNKHWFHYQKKSKCFQEQK